MEKPFLAGDKSKFRSAWVQQLDQSDCGVACLAMLVKLHGGGEAQIDRLREVSGTNKSGTSMKGLEHGAQEFGLEVDFFEAESIEEFRNECDQTAVLHVTRQTGTMMFNHFVVYLGFRDGKYLVLDPADGYHEYSEEELKKIWLSRALMTAKPGKNFRNHGSIRNEKRGWIKKLVEDDLNVLGILLFLGFVVSVLSMSFAIFSKVLIDDILPNKAWDRLYIGMGLLFFLMIVSMGISSLRSYFLLQQNLQFNNRILRFFYSKLLRLPKSFFDNRKTGDLIARMNDTSRIQSVIAYIGTSLMIDVMMAAISLITIFLFTWQLGLVALAAIPVIALLTIAYSKPLYKKQREVMAAFATNESNFIDTMQGVGPLKSNNREEVFSNLTMMVYGVFQKSIYDLGLLRIKFGVYTGLANVFFNVAVISVGALMVMNGQLLLGAMMGVMQVINTLMPTVARIASTNIQLQEAKAAFERMFEFTSIKQEYDPVTDESLPRIGIFEKLEAQNVTFRFPGREELLKGISFRVSRGEMIAILGESGSGKSTTLQILEKFYSKEKGIILVNGRDWEQVSVQEWRSMMASVPQEIKIFNGTMINNICLGLPPDSPAKLKFIVDYGFDKFFNHLPLGFETVIGENGLNLSGGQQQLVAIMRALYKKPQVLILDEATSAMDRNTEKFILDLLQKLKKDIAVIMVTHRVQTAKLADRIYVLESGKFAATGNHNELVKGDSLYGLAWRDILGVESGAKDSTAGA